MGFPLPGVGLRVRGDDGRDLAHGEIGGIEVKGPNVFKGYWRMPEKTKEEFTADGWFKTGDVGKIDERGYVTIVGRSKDLIISGGYNVYPAEIEGYINDMPGVAESALVGVPHPDFGEVGVAVVTAKPGAQPGRRADRGAAEIAAGQLQDPQALLRGGRASSQHHGQGAEEPAARAAHETVHLGPVSTRKPSLMDDNFYNGRISNLRNFTWLPPPYSSATGPLANRLSSTSAVFTPLSITVMWLPLTVMS